MLDAMRAQLYHRTHRYGVQHMRSIQFWFFSVPNVTSIHLILLSPCSSIYYKLHLATSNKSMFSTVSLLLHNSNRTSIRLTNMLVALSSLISEIKVVRLPISSYIIVIEGVLTQVYTLI